MQAETLDLQDPKQFAQACALSKQRGHASSGIYKPATVIVDGLYCPPCGARRAVDFTWSPYVPGIGEMPMVASMRCRQCHVAAHGFFFEGPSGPDLVIARTVEGGIATPKTPDAVKFYLDQAARAESASARSAAVAMYRAAIEQLLFDQGFVNGMLQAKITEFEKKKTAGNAPKWAEDVDADVLTVLKELGNGAIHTNGGDIKKQAALDDTLIVAVRATVAMLLDVVYEEPARRAARLAALKSAAQVVKK